MSGNDWRWLPPKFLGKADLGGRLAFLGSIPHGELFFFLMQKEPAMVPDSETFSPFINADIRSPFFSADVLKKCALVALHLTSEGRKRWRGMTCPQCGGRMGSESGDEAWSEDESVSSHGSREGHVGNDALHVIGLCGHLSSLEGLGAGQRWHRVATWPWTCSDRKCTVAGLPLPRGPLSQQESLSLTMDGL